MNSIGLDILATLAFAVVVGGIVILIRQVVSKSR